MSFHSSTWIQLDLPSPQNTERAFVTLASSSVTALMAAKNKLYKEAAQQHCTLKPRGRMASVTAGGAGHDRLQNAATACG